MKDGVNKGKVSLARALSKMGYCSRSEAMKHILAGHVKVNGRKITDPSYRCTPERDRIAVEGVRLKKEEFVYILMNKPAGAVTTRSDELGRNTVYDILGDLGVWVFPVGRLDKETSGLLLLTNDTRFGEDLTNPDSHMTKEYRVEAYDELTDRQVELLSKPMTIDGLRLRGAEVARAGAREIILKITEGKNRQIRRMCAVAGCEVVKLERIRIGPIGLGDLAPGAWRYLETAEVDRLRKSR